MNVFHKFTRMSLKHNRTRTLVTVIGIVLSMSLFTAVIEGAYSGQQYLIRSEIAEVGAFHGYFYDLTAGELKEASEADGISDTASWQEVGWADIGSENEYKPYLLIEAVSDNFTDLVSLHILKGRMPENDSEILLPEHLATNGNVKYSVGDTVTLQVGQRTSDGYALNARNPYSPEVQEEITDASEKTYTVVGICSRLNYTIEKYDCPGYTALTVGNGSGSYTMFFTTAQPSKFFTYMNDASFSDNMVAHSDLLALNGSLRNSNLMLVLYGFAAVLIFLIAFGSISLIYNSFSISVSERTKQFGILKSVGATRKQIRGSVFYEALLLSAVGIPVGMLVGCTGIGITLWCLRDSFSGILSSGQDVQMYLVLNPGALCIAAAICLITTLISAWIPAKKAIRINAIDAIRQTKDIRLRKKNVRTFGLSRKLFGFSGMLASKNFRRDRKRYRSTVISLFMSITLFISASSFCSYLTDSVSGITSGSIDTDICYYTVEDDGYEPDTVLSLLLGAEGVGEGTYVREAIYYLSFDSSSLTQEYLNLPFVSRENRNATDGTVNVSVNMIFLNDETFRQLCRDNELNSESYFDRDNPAALAVNNVTETYSEEGKPAKWYHYELFDTSQLPVTGSIQVSKEIDGYEHFTVGAVINDLPFYVSASDHAALIYPYSMLSALTTEYTAETAFVQTAFLFTAENHAQTYNSMKTILAENNLATSLLYDLAASRESERMMITVINVFSFGFIILISLIAVANVFNTISTNVALRRREFAMLKSIGISQKDFRRMMNYECIIYGVRSLMWGLPASVVLTYIIWRISGIAYESRFYIPWYSIAIAVGSVFAVVFATMLYATKKLRKDNPIDALKTENL